MRKFIFVIALFSLAGCAGAQLKKDMEARRYSAEDLAAIESQAKPYKDRLTPDLLAPMRSEEWNRNFDGLKIIFCKCYKELKDKCRQAPNGLTADQKSLWIKANAVDWAVASIQDSNPTRKIASVDPDTCP